MGLFFFLFNPLNPRIHTPQTREMRKSLAHLMNRKEQEVQQEQSPQ